MGTTIDELFIEYPYYDKDYLSVYYLHYSKKLTTFSKWCVRLHLIKDRALKGYLVLRPVTEGCKIGKSYIEPDVLVRKPARLMLSNVKTHLLGNTREIRCFPWASQYTDVSVCAHEALWTVLRYHGIKHSEYRDISIGSIAEATHITGRREIPSPGLKPSDVAELLKHFHYSPLMVWEPLNLFPVLDNVAAYVESGLPMIGFLYPREHAVSIIGRSEIDYSLLLDKEMLFQLKKQGDGIILQSRLIKSFYVMDDNLFPYQEMPVSLPVSQSGTVYGLGEIKHFVIPLYKRMQLDYDAVYSRFYAWFKGGINVNDDKNDFTVKWEEPCVCNIYLTSSNSLKEEALYSKDMNPLLIDTIINLVMSRFVWCIDISSIATAETSTCGRIIVDATAASEDNNSWLLFHNNEYIVYRDIEDNGSINWVKCAIGPYTKFTRNLKKVG